MALLLDVEPVETVPLTVKDNVIRVGDTRVTLDTVIEVFLEGATPEEIVSRYPTLQLGDVYTVVGYYLRHRNEVEAYLARHREQTGEVRRQNEQRFPPEGVRARLLARQTTEV